MRRWHAALLVAALATPARGDELAIVKSVAILSDPVGTALPKSLPGAVAEYRIRATNPLGNTLKTVKTLQLVDYLPGTVAMRVSDLVAAGKGPVEFADGNLLGSGLLASGLGYSYSSATPATDGLEFWDGTSWAYQPVADAGGYDANVRGIRVTLTGNFASTTSFQLRYRVRIR